MERTMTDATPAAVPTEDTQAAPVEPTTDQAVEQTPAETEPAVEPAVTEPVADQADKPSDETADDQADDQGQDKAEDEPVFSAADLERIIQARLGRQEKAHQKELAALRAETGGEALADAEKARDAALAELDTMRTETAVRFAAIAAGVPADATDAIVKLADVADAKTDNGVDVDKVQAAVKSVLDRFPGLVGKPVAGASEPQPGVGSGPSQAEPQKTRPASIYEAVMNDPRFAR